MAEASAEQFEDFRRQEKSAIVLGYTGEIGKLLVEELAKHKIFKHVFLVGRREVQLPADLGPVFEQRLVDFDKLDEYADTFKGSEVTFCCMGTTRRKAGAAGFVKVDRDYVLKAAELSKAGGCKHFQLISSAGANKNSFFLYTKTKGEVEEGLKDIQFDRLSIFRPAALLVDRQENRTGEKIAFALLTPIFKLFPTAISVPGRSVALAMINKLVMPAENKVEIIENKQIHKMSGQKK